MRIYIHTPTGKKFPLEAESSDTIHHVKGLIQKKEGISRQEQILMFSGTQLEDSETLSNSSIHNESIVGLVYNLEGGMRIHIKASPGNLFTVVIRTPKPRISDLKAEIEKRIGVPVNEQRLIYSGEVLGSGFNIVADSTIRLVRIPDSDNAALSTEKRTGNQDAELPKVGSKRAREDSSSTNPRHSEGLLSCGANRVQGLESFWDEKDFGLAWRRSQSLISPYDTSRFESQNPRMLIESVANECVRTLNITAFLDSQLQEYRDKLSLAKKEVERLSKQNAYTEDSLHKEKECVKKLTQELDVERSAGTSFLQSEAGQRHIVTLKRQAAKSGVDEFKKSAACKELVMDRAISVYNDAVARCQTLLRESGRVSEDIIQLLVAE